jgi:hypothetical protein
VLWAELVAQCLVVVPVVPVVLVRVPVLMQAKQLAS